MFEKIQFNCTEGQVFVAEGNNSIYVMEYIPEGNVRAVVLIVPPDGEERYWSQRTLVNAARKLASCGILVIRFDYVGQGESAGEYAQTDVVSRVNNIETVLSYVKSKTSECPIGVIGVRLGGALVMDALNNTGGADFVIMWEPVLNIEDYIDNLLRINTATQMAIDKMVTRNRNELKQDIVSGEKVSVNGYLINKAFYQQLIELGDKGLHANFHENKLVIKSQSCTIQSGGHDDKIKVRYTPFWREPRLAIEFQDELINQTLLWINTQLD